MIRFSLICLALTAGLVFTQNVLMPEGEEFPDNIPDGDNFIAFDYDLFKSNLNSLGILSQNCTLNYTTSW